MDAGRAPQGIRRGHLRTTAAISALMSGRPPVGRPESWVQCSRKRRRCHRRTVSGETMTRACRQPVQTLASPTQNRRSILRSLGRGAVLLYTASWWRRARFSRASWRWPPKRKGKRRSRWSRRVITSRDCGRTGPTDQTTWLPDGVLARDRQSAAGCRHSQRAHAAATR